MEDVINNTLKYIEEQIGLKLQLCDYFIGIRELNGCKYFNIILQQRVSESKVYAQLIRFSNKFKTIKVEPNGMRRVALFIKRS